MKNNDSTNFLRGFFCLMLTLYGVFVCLFFFTTIGHAFSSNATLTLRQELMSATGGEVGTGTPTRAQTAVGATAAGETSNGTFRIIGGIGNAEVIPPTPASFVVTINGTVDDPAAAVTVNGVLASMSGNSFSLSLTLPMGSNSLTAIARDPAGNTRTKSVTVSVIPPPRPPAMPTVGTFGAPIPLFTAQSSLTIGGTKTPNTSIWINGAQVVALSSATTWTATVTLVEGDNELFVEVHGPYGTPSAKARVLIVLDTLPPVVTFTPPTKTNLDPITLTGTVDDSLTTVTINGVVSTRTGRTFQAAVPLPVIGANVIQLTAISPNGYRTDRTVSITRGTIPTITAVQPAQASKLYAAVATTLQVNAADAEADPISYQILLDGVVLIDWGSGRATTWTPTTSQFGPHTVTLKARDAYGGDRSQSVNVYVLRKPVSPP